ncbi:MAG TPA: WD40 repeat domain-containing protein, partial [Nocardioides sp.]|nr:WD40 repeat domain-containing protein [Nocardioides sp.]
DASLVASFPDDAQSYFTTAAFSADGSEFVTAGGDGYATVRAIDGRFLSFVQHEAAIDEAAFSPDGHRLATASEDASAKATDIQSGKTLATFTGHTGPVSSVAFNPAGNLVATGGKDGVVRLWRADGGAEVAGLVGHQAPINQVSFAPDGDSLLSASDDSTARVWSTAGSAEAFPEDTTTAVPSAEREAFSPGGGYAAVSWHPDGADGAEVAVFVVATGGLLGQFAPGDEQLVPAVSADGDLTVTSSFEGATIRRTSDGTAVAQVPVTSVYAAAFDASEDRVLVVGETGQAGIYRTADGTLLTALVGHDTTREVVGAAFSADGSRAATASVDGTVRVWDTGSGEQLLQLDAFGPPHHMYEQHAVVAFSPDGKLLATGAEYEVDAQLWDARTGARLTTLEGSKSDLVDLAFSADGRFIVTAPRSGSVRLWDGHSGRPLADVTDAGVEAAAATFTDSGGIALVEGGDNGDSLAVLRCTVCGDLDSLVKLAKTRVTRGLTATEKATYLNGG